MGSLVLEKMVLDTRSVSLKNFAGTHVGGVTRMYTGFMTSGPGPSINSPSSSSNNNPLSPTYRPPSYGLENPSTPFYLDVTKNIEVSVIKPLPLPKIEPVLQPTQNLLKDVEPLLKPSYSGLVIPHPKIVGVPDLHDTYKLDRYNNLYKGHTTINLVENKKIRLNHEY